MTLTPDFLPELAGEGYHSWKRGACKCKSEAPAMFLILDDHWRLYYQAYDVKEPNANLQILIPCRACNQRLFDISNFGKTLALWGNIWRTDLEEFKYWYPPIMDHRKIVHQIAMVRYIPHPSAVISRASLVRYTRFPVLGQRAVLNRSNFLAI